MTTKEKVEHVEKEFDVEKLCVTKFGKTFQIYPWIKGRLFHKIITGADPLQKKDLKLFWKQLKSLFYGWWNFYRRYDVWAFTHSGERRLIDGKYFDKFFDYIGNESKLKVFVVETRLVSYYPYRKVASEYVASKSGLLFLEELYARFILGKIDQKIIDEVNDIAEFMSIQINSREILRKYLAQYRVMKLWLRVFPNPKTVFLTVSYSNFGYIRALKEAKIKVVEFQHGLITKNHHAYYYKKEMDPIQFPDIIATLGLREVQVFDSENHFPIQDIRPIGSFIIDYYQKKAERKLRNKVPRIIITFQDGLIGDELAIFVEELVTLIESKIELLIQVRRTPIQYYKDKFPGLKGVSFSTTDFYSGCILCDIHATIYSTTAIEALSLGKPNILINLGNLAKEQLGSSIGDNPYSIFVETPAEFVVAVSKLQNADVNDVIESNKSNICKGYKENISQLLNELGYE